MGRGERERQRETAERWWVQKLKSLLWYGEVEEVGEVEEGGAETNDIFTHFFFFFLGGNPTEKWDRKNSKKRRLFDIFFVCYMRRRRQQIFVAITDNKYKFILARSPGSESRIVVKKIKTRTKDKKGQIHPRSFLAPSDNT